MLPELPKSWMSFYIFSKFSSNTYWAILCVVICLQKQGSMIANGYNHVGICLSKIKSSLLLSDSVAHKQHVCASVSYGNESLSWLCLVGWYSIFFAFLFELDLEENILKDFPLNAIKQTPTTTPTVLTQWAKNCFCSELLLFLPCYASKLFFPVIQMQPFLETCSYLMRKVILVNYLVI